MAIASRHVRVERDGDIAVMHTDRPPANAIDIALLAELQDTLEQVAQDPPGALVFAGRPGFFSAGADLKAAATLDRDGEREMVARLNGAFLAAYSLPFPVVAAITGHAVAGGFIFALCADVRIASRDGRFGVTEVKVGLPYPVVPMGIVRNELDPQTARYLALSSELVDAQWCERRGIFDELREPDAVLARARETATALAALPARAYALAKRDLRGAAIEAMAAAHPDDPLLRGWSAG